MRLGNELATSALTDLLFDEPGVGRCLVAPDGSVRRANGEWARLSGSSLDAVVGANMIDLFPQARDMAVAMHARAGQHVDLPLHAQRIDGRETWWEGSIDSVSMEGGTGLLIRIWEVHRGLPHDAGAGPALPPGEAPFRTMADESPVILWISDAHGDSQFVNRTYREFFGVTFQDVEGTRWRPLVHPDDAPRYLEGYLGAVREQAAFSGEARVRRKDGEWRWIASILQPRFADTGQFLGHVGVSMDITERKRAEAALRDRERQARDRAAELRAVLDAVPAAVFISHDLAAGSMQTNRFAAETLRMATGRSVSENAPEGERPPHPRAMRNGIEIPPEQLPVRVAAATGREIRDCEFDLVLDDGDVRKLFGNSSPLLDADGGCIGAVGAFIDVTERRRVEDALRESESLYRSLFTLAPSGVVVTDEGGRIHEFNDQAHENLGYSRAEFGGLRIWNLDADEAPEDVRRRSMEIIDAGSSEFDVRHRTKSGELRHVRCRSRVVHLGGARRILSVLQDVTDRKHAEEALREADRRKTEFLGILSHELRNPLAPIRNSIYLLEHASAGSEQSARARDVIHRQTEHLTRLVDDLLDVTRISRGKIALQRTHLDLREIVRKTTDDLYSVFQQAGVALRVDAGFSPVWVDADPTRMSQVLGNLLQNSVKFTGAGGEVALSLAIDGTRAEVSVRDSGIGMEPADIAHMFEPFAQAEQTLARTKGGLGLGLALVKGLVELHGGTVEARSEGLGRGSEFLVRLPRAEAGAEGRRDTAAAHARAQSILVVEDNLDAGQSLADILALQGHHVRIARDGRSGIALARELRPDVILCDIGLPDLDGFEVARTIRHDEALRSTRLIALSGYAQPEDRQRTREIGFDAHIAKPPDLDELMSVLANQS